MNGKFREAGATSGASGFNVQDLNRLASILAQGAQQLTGLAASAPAIPDAGASTGLVGDALSSLCGMMSTITRTAANAADQAQSNSTSYEVSDDTAGEDFAKFGGSL
jgi:hypothetical protein